MAGAFVSSFYVAIDVAGEMEVTKRPLCPSLLGDSYLGWSAHRPDPLCVLHMYTSSVSKKGASIRNENSEKWPFEK